MSFPAFPVPRVESPDGLLDSRGIQQNFDALMAHPLPQVRVFHPVNSIIPNGFGGPLVGFAWPLIFQRTRWDLGPALKQHDDTVNSGRLTCRVAGLYLIGINLRWDGASGVGQREAIIVLNNAVTIAHVVDGDFAGMAQAMSTQYRLKPGDFLEVGVAQTSGGPLAVLSLGQLSPEFFMHWVSP